MAIDERTRHQLFLRLEEFLGEVDANTLMEHLPPVGWVDVATKRDLDSRVELAEKRLMGVMHEDMATLRSGIDAHTRVLLIALVGSMLTLATLVLART